MGALYHNLFDSHTHSVNSPDGVHSLMYLAEQAEEKKLIGLAITDHVECLGFEEQGFRTRLVQSAVDTAKAKEAFRHRMTLAFGIELGVYPGMYETAEYILGLYPYDFVVGACHFSRQGKSLARTDYTALSRDETHKLLSEYFEDMLELARWGKFDSLAHITYPTRWAMKWGLHLSVDPYREIIDEILRVLVNFQKALEVNTSGLRGPLEQTLPPKWVVERYKEMGGELITIGSDAHNSDYIGHGLSQAMEMLAGVGYKYFAFYRERKPIMLKII